MAEKTETKKEAVIRVKGTQFIVREGQELEVDRLTEKAGSKFDAEVLMSTNGKDIEIGTPLTKNAKVTLEVLAHKKGEKIQGMRFKAKSRYRRKFGYRSSLTVLKVNKIA
jgi:large subunit ribosomal protein L21